MKKLLFAVAILCCVASYSQKKTKEERQAILDAKHGTNNYSPRDSLVYPIKYCLIVATGKMFSKQVDISVDYGQNARFFEDTSVLDQNGKKIVFHSVVDALNYMESIGWTFVNAYVVTDGGQNVYNYLMRASDQLDQKYLPKTKRDFRTSSN